LHRGATSFCRASDSPYPRHARTAIARSRSPFMAGRILSPPADVYIPDERPRSLHGSTETALGGFIIPTLPLVNTSPAFPLSAAKAQLSDVRIHGPRFRSGPIKSAESFETRKFGRADARRPAQDVTVGDAGSTADRQAPGVATQFSSPVQRSMLDTLSRAATPKRVAKAGAALVSPIGSPQQNAVEEMLSEPVSPMQSSQGGSSFGNRGRRDWTRSQAMHAPRPSDGPYKSVHTTDVHDSVELRQRMLASVDYASRAFTGRRVGSREEQGDRRPSVSEATEPSEHDEVPIESLLFGPARFPWPRSNVRSAHPLRNSSLPLENAGKREHILAQPGGNIVTSQPLGIPRGLDVRTVRAQPAAHDRSNPGVSGPDPDIDLDKALPLEPQARPWNARNWNFAGPSPTHKPGELDHYIRESEHRERLKSLHRRGKELRSRGAKRIAMPLPSAFSVSTPASSPVPAEPISAEPVPAEMPARYQIDKRLSRAFGLDDDTVGRFNSRPDYRGVMPQLHGAGLHRARDRAFEAEAEALEVHAYVPTGFRRRGHGGRDAWHGDENACADAAGEADGLSLDERRLTGARRRR